MADIPGTWLDERLPSNRAESETAGAVDVEGFRAWWNANMEPDRPSVAYWLVRETAQKAYAAGHDAERARAERLATLLRDLLEPIEGRWVDEDHRDQDALRIRRLLDLCSTGGCANKRGPEEADGFCFECCEDGEWPDADTWSEERKARVALAGDAPGRGEASGG